MTRLGSDFTFNESSPVCKIVMWGHGSRYCILPFPLRLSLCNTVTLHYQINLEASACKRSHMARDDAATSAVPSQ